MLEFIEWLCSVMEETLYLKKNNGRYSVSIDKENWQPLDKGVAKMLKERLKIETIHEDREENWDGYSL